MARLGNGRANWSRPGSTEVASCDRQLNPVHPVRGCRVRRADGCRVHLDGWVRRVCWVRSVHLDRSVRSVRLGSRVRQVQVVQRERRVRLGHLVHRVQSARRVRSVLRVRRAQQVPLGARGRGTA